MPNFGRQIGEIGRYDDPPKKTRSRNFGREQVGTFKNYLVLDIVQRGIPVCDLECGGRDVGSNDGRVRDILGDCDSDRAASRTYVNKWHVARST